MLTSTPPYFDFYFIKTVKQHWVQQEPASDPSNLLLLSSSAWQTDTINVGIHTRPWLVSFGEQFLVVPGDLFKGWYRLYWLKAFQSKDVLKSHKTWWCFSLEMLSPNLHSCKYAVQSFLYIKYADDPTIEIFPQLAQISLKVLKLHLWGLEKVLGLRQRVDTCLSAGILVKKNARLYTFLHTRTLPHADTHIHAKKKKNHK